jgi:hypothetical protein
MTKRVSIEDMTEVALECRDMRHWWDHVTDKEIVKSGGQVVKFKRYIVCRKCGAEKTQSIDCTSFDVVSASSKYPDGYLHDGGRVSVSEVRREQYRRVGLKF